MLKGILSKGLVAGLVAVTLYGCSGANTTTPGASTNSSAAVADNHSLKTFHFDVEKAQSEEDMIQKSHIIVRGSFTGEVTEVQTSDDPERIFSDYFYTIKIDEVLFGDASRERIEVVRGGLSSIAKGNGYVSADNYDAAIDHAHKDYIFFLQPSAKSGVYQVVGHVSGVMKLDDKNKTKDVAPEVKGLENLELAAIKDKIAGVKKLK